MSDKWYTKKWLIVAMHIAAWVLLFSLPFLLRPNYGGEDAHRQKENAQGLLGYIINDLIYVTFFYINALFLIPSFIYKRKYKKYGIIIILCFTAVLEITWLVLFYLLGQSGFNIQGHLLFNFFFFLFFLAASTAYRMILDRTRADRIAREKETENLKTELSLLRSQASPHFMFNVLNNMVALARKKSDLLEPSLLKFSSLMRYMLYEADEEKVGLEKEIEYLHSYIDLQMQRFGSNVLVEVDIDNTDNHYELEPMLLIPFVENAFKHGTGIIEEAHIIIRLKVENEILFFSVENRFNPDSVEIKDKTSGIGLTNVKRRLNLLYGEKQQLLITQKDKWFTASLKINLH